MAGRPLVCLFIAIFAALASCTDPPPSRPVLSAPEDPSASRHDYRALSVLWMKTAGEVRALQYQAFNIARERLDRELTIRRPGEKLAVIVDVDETVLDTSGFQAGLIRGNRAFPDGWTEWIASAQARAVPGAVAFLQYAADKGVDVFYITNRGISTQAGTMENLTELGFPHVRHDRMLCKTMSSDKEPRRQTVAETHHTVLLLGDALNDFAAVFYKRPLAERTAEVDKLRNEFGRRFIVLPNPMYGHWESALYDYNQQLSSSQRSTIRHRFLGSVPEANPGDKESTGEPSSE